MFQFSSALRRKLVATTALGVTLALATPAAAQQMGSFGTVQGTVGPVTVSQSGANLDVTATGGGILNWNGFKVDQGSTATFRNGNGAQAPAVAILNRVAGGQASRIDGALVSDKNVSLYVINANGVVFGSTASVDVGSLTASTLDVTDADFLDNDSKLHFTGASTAAVETQAGGALTASGDLVFLGQAVTLDATATAGGTLAAVAAPEVTVQAAPNSPLKFQVARGGLASRLTGKGDLTARNITLAVAADAAATGLLQLDGVLKSTGVEATDDGISIVARDGALNEPTTIDFGVTGKVAVKLGATASSAADIYIASRGDVDVRRLDAQDFVGIITLGAANALETISASNMRVAAGKVSVNSLLGPDITVYSDGLTEILGDVIGRNVSIGGAGIALAGNRVEGSYVRIRAGTGSVWSGEDLTISGSTEVLLEAGAGINLDDSSKILAPRALLIGGNAGSALAFGDIDAGSITGLDQWTGDLTFGAVRARDDIAIATSGNIISGTMTTQGALAVSGASLRLGDVLAGSGLNIDGSRLEAGRLDGGTGSVVVDAAQSLFAGAVNGNDIDLRASAGGINTDNLSARGAISLRSSDSVSIGNAVAGGDITALVGGFYASSLATGPGNVRLIASDGSVTVRKLSAGGNVDIEAHRVRFARADTSLHDLTVGGALNVASEDIWLDGAKADTIRLDSASNGVIKLSAAITAKSLNLIGGTVQQDAGSGLVSEILSASLVGEAKLTGSNRIARLDAFSAGSLALTNQSSKLEITGSSNFGGAVVIDTGGDLQFAAGASLHASTASITAGGLFNNLSGPSAIVAADHWAMYLGSPDGHSFGGLDSANRAIWGGDTTSRPISSLTGNRYVFRYAPTLTIFSADVTKEYGTDISSHLAAYTVSGLSAGSAYAFEADTLADVIAGTPLLSSAGAGAHASVLGGPYAIDIAQGSMSSPAGYVLAFANQGRLRVTPRQIGGTVSVQDKTYDGGLATTGSIVLSGVLFDDQISAAGNFQFLDKNAGIGKTVILGSLRVTGADSANYQVVLPANLAANILRRQVTMNVVADNKTYDQTRAASGRVTALDGVIAGDVVTSTGGTFEFTDKNAGIGKVVTVSGIGLSGVDAANYDFIVPAITTADIYRKAVDVSVAVDDKTYDGTTNATGRITGSTGILSGDQVLVTGGAFAFADKNAGIARHVLVSGVDLSGADAANYDVALPANAAADIARKTVGVAFAVDNKTYDGTAAATGQITGISDVVAGDELGITGASYAFADRYAGTGKQVSLTGMAASGADAANYELVAKTNVTADIFRKAITASVVVDSKTYDGTTAASGHVSALDGLIAGDQITLGDGTYAFTDRNAGSGKQVLVSGIAMSGADASNYILTVPATATADILRRTVQVGIVAADKVYDGSLTASGRVASVTGIIAGDSVTVDGGQYSFVDANAGADKAVTVVGLAASGADAGNYVIAAPEAATAAIFKRSLAVRANDVRAGWFGSAAPLSYTIVAGSIVPGDGFTGELSREPGEVPGRYRIGQGTLAIGTNYDVQFVPGTYVIENRGSPRFLLPHNPYQELELGGRAEVLKSAVSPIRWADLLPACAEEATPRCQ